MGETGLMINNLRLKWLKFKIKFLCRFTKPEEFSELLRLEGIKVGKGTIFYDPNSQTIDRQRPWMIKIGEYCKITKGTVILAHDYSRSVLRRVYGEIIGEAGETIIGDNVFIGMNSIILMGAHIGNNVIIGAGSVVSGIIPDNVVVAGNPAHIIRTLDEHFKIRKNKYVNEAKLYARTFYINYGKMPTIHEMNAFFPLYLQRSRAAIKQYDLNVKLNGDNSDEVVDAFLRTKPFFQSYQEFLDNAIENRK